MAKKITFNEIWDNFTSHKIKERDIDVREIQQKNKTIKLYYYKWSSCWREVVKRYPNSTYEFERFERDGKLYDCMYYADGSASVHCTVNIEGHHRKMFLPVMNFKNMSITNPSSREISDNKMRCLVKTIAMFGLGLDLYEGDYEPEPPTETTEGNVINLDQERKAEEDRDTDEIRESLYREAVDKIKSKNDTANFFVQNKDKFSDLKTRDFDAWKELCNEIKSHKENLIEKENV